MMPVDANSIKVTYTVREPVPDRWFGQVHASYTLDRNGFKSDHIIPLAIIYPFASETTARKYTKKLLETEKRKWSKKRIMKEFKLN